MNRSAVQSNNPEKSHEAHLGAALERRLLAYTAAATAAGMGILASGKVAEAKIVYTPADKHIRVNGGVVNLDLDHDGTTDFTFQAEYHLGTGHGTGGNLVLKPRTVMGGAVNYRSQGLSWVAALPKGQKIGPGDMFESFRTEILASGVVGASTTLSGGPWTSPTRAYVGLKFAIKGKVHYGWVRVVTLGSSQRFHYRAVITGYAYETSPNKAIIAGKTTGSDDASVEGSNAALAMPTAKPATLGMLALGAPGLSIWRREESAVAAR
jgi:hypothetical protein